MENGQIYINTCVNWKLSKSVNEDTLQFSNSNKFEKKLNLPLLLPRSSNVESGNWCALKEDEMNNGNELPLNKNLIVRSH